MASKKRIRINYGWKLFLPIICMVWLLMIILVLYHYKSASSYRDAAVRAQLSIINNRILAAYEDDLDIQPFLNFIERYFDNSILEEVMVTVYDNVTQDTIQTIGPSYEDIGIIEDKGPVRGGLGKSISLSQHLMSDKLFFVSKRQSNDGRIIVTTALPYSGALSDALRSDPSFWIIVFGIAIVFTIIAYFMSTKYLSRSVRMLKNYVDALENDSDLAMNMPEFPHDELGDISRRIVTLYREKADANLRSEREHAVAIHAVEERARIKRQLTNNLNHELKTPIGVIRGYLDTIISTPDMDPGVKERFIGRAYENVERLCAMLEDISTISRLEDGSKNISMADVDFHEIVFNIAHDFELSGTLNGMEFSYDIPLNCHVKGNATLLTSMICNLAKNAVIHSHGSEIGLKLIIESKRFYTFAFWDNGTGVESEHLQRIFERFYRIDSGRSRKVGGTGLGLPIVKNTVESHGGTISVHNRVAGGLEFIFTLPKFDADDKPRRHKLNDNDDN